ncbi:MAG: maltose alpha-D-glucosyltransferase [Chloroflexi bacterium]|nr:maltose alpha-D-glucosyltransferase [Chloroflexota bacterium]
MREGRSLARIAHAVVDGGEHWYKDAVIYEVPVRAFLDSNGDGIGDFAGLTQKLDYIHDLGVTAIWLLPFYSSPQRDDGYDIADYRGVHASYGSLQDFRVFVREAHRRGLRVITELVINHTSDQHRWFQRARRAPRSSRWRQFYVWSDRPDRYEQARIIFEDFESSNWTWDPVAQASYWHRFYSHQPDLNFDSPDVRRSIRQVAEFWLGLGVDGLRLDAVPYLYEREGTSCENLEETHAFLRDLRRTIDARYAERMLLAEANQWPEDAAAYFGQGDECQMAFHFPMMPRLFMAIRMEESFPVVDILRQTPSIPANSQWALFLRNHDELTLEMVTDEDRDYMYRVYARDPEARINLGIRRRLAPLLGNHRRRIELMNALLLSLPGTPVVYYGDEIGMGDNIYLGDRNGVRTPMQWSSDRNAGFSRSNAQRLYLPPIVDPEYHYEALNVEAQQANPHSLLWWTKRIIALRKRSHAFGRGSIDLLHPENPHVLAFLRCHGEERILVVANLSRFAQVVELDLRSWEGMVPIEMFGRVSFPPIGDSPYLLTLAPHTFFWFSLERQRIEAAPRVARPTSELPVVVASGPWTTLVTGRQRARLEAVFPAYLVNRRWFGSKARTLQAVTIQDAIPLGAPGETPDAYILLLHAAYLQGEPEIYVLPITAVAGEQARQLLADSPHAVIAQLEVPGELDVLLVDAMWDASFCRLLLHAIGSRRRLRGDAGELIGAPTRAFATFRRRDGQLDPSAARGEQSNTSIIYGGRLILKLFRRPDEGINPDLEIGRFLSEVRAFPQVPSLVGSIQYRQGRREPRTVAILQRFVSNQGDAWRHTLDVLATYFERALAQPDGPPNSTSRRPLELARAELAPEAYAVIGPYLESARLLGQRTAELHLALASGVDDPNLTSEPFTPFHQRALYHSLRRVALHALHLVRRRLAGLSAEAREAAQHVLEAEDRILQRFQFLLGRQLGVARMRCHGDLHLGQVLFTGDDFCFIDFEGEPARPLSERRRKRPALRDVAGMLRSFNYAARVAVDEGMQRTLRTEDLADLQSWAHYWVTWVSAAYLKGYLSTAGEVPFLPRDPEELRLLANALLLEKALYELDYELNNRPEWVDVPLRGVLELLEEDARDG